MDVIKFNTKLDHYTRLAKSLKNFRKSSPYTLLTMALEAPFFGKNVQSMLKLGRTGCMYGCCIIEKNSRI